VLYGLQGVLDVGDESLNVLFGIEQSLHGLLPLVERQGILSLAHIAPSASVRIRVHVDQFGLLCDELIGLGLFVAELYEMGDALPAVVDRVRTLLNEDSFILDASFQVR